MVLGMKGVSVLPMHESEEGASGHVLCNDGQVGRLRNCSQEEQHIHMPQLLHDACLTPELL